MDNTRSFTPISKGTMISLFRIFEKIEIDMRVCGQVGLCSLEIKLPAYISQVG